MSACDYYFFNPVGWICHGGAALTKGLAGGTVDGVVGGAASQLNQAFDKLSENFGRVAQDAFSKFTAAASNASAEDVGEKVALAMKNFLEGIKKNSNISLDPDKLGKDLGETFKKLGESFAQGLDVNGEKFGGKVGQEINDIFNTFWDKADLKDLSTRLTTEFREAFEAGIKNAKLAQNIQLAADEIGEGLKVFRQNGFREIDGFRNDVQQIFANMARDTALKVIPWLALGSAIAVGTPLLVLYLFYKAKHNIGRPKLAAEVRHVDLYNKVYDGVLDTIAGIWKSAKPGLKWATVVGVSGLGLASTACILDAITPIDEVIPKSLFNNSRTFMNEFFCRLGFFSYWHCQNYNFENFDIWLGASLAIGGAVSAYTAGRLIYEKITSKSSNFKAVFNDELMDVINDITCSTYNLKKHGGFFQNVLLYGPGGTGKTMIAKLIARNSKMNYVMMSGGDLAQYISRGEHITELNKLFLAAKSSSTPTIIFIDEAEALCLDRELLKKTGGRHELLELVDGFLAHAGEQSKNFMIILATNRKEDLDPAVLSRMDYKLFIGPPQLAERKKILKGYIPHFFSKKEQETFFNESIINKISEATNGMTGRALFKMLNGVVGKKYASKDNQLTSGMIDIVVKRFVEQEVEPSKTIEPTTPIMQSTTIEPSRQTKPSTTIEPSKPIDQKVDTKLNFNIRPLDANFLTKYGLKLPVYDAVKNQGK